MSEISAWRFVVLNLYLSILLFSVYRSLPAFSTSSSLANSDVDPTCRKEAPKIENEYVLSEQDEIRQRSALESTISVPTKVPTLTNLQFS